MNTKADRFFADMKGKRVAFLGIGISNAPLIDLFLAAGADVTACDQREAGQLDGQETALQEKGVSLRLGADYLGNLDFDIVFRTPGMQFYLPQLTAARERGVVVTSEMEVFFALCPCKTIAVSGSDGKTTTSTVIAECLKEAGYTVHLGGNIGTPLLPRLAEMKPSDIVVAELSSFQLISMRQSPDIAVVTNVQPNHLDIHKDYEEYIDAKKNLVIHQNAFSKTVLNLDNEVTREQFKPLVRGRLAEFSRKEKPVCGAYWAPDGELLMLEYGRETRVMHRDDIRLVGDHNVENYLTVIAAVWGLVPPEVIKTVAKRFGGVAHRMEFVRELDGVKWYNDSIASSPTRTIAGLNAYGQRVILIAGGYDKNLSYEPMGDVMAEKVKHLILMGPTAQKIEQALLDSKLYFPQKVQIHPVSSMEEAVQKARELGRDGDIVAMSPASASFDQYRNFEYRGNHFKQLVKDLV